MKIALIGNSSETLLKFRLSLMEKLAINHTVYAVAPSFAPDEKLILTQAKIIPISLRINRVGLNPITELVSIVELVKFFINYKIDCSFSYFIKPVIYANIAGFIARVPRRISLIEGLGFFFTWENSFLTLKQKLLKSIITLLLRISLPLAHKVIFLNHDDQREVLSMAPSLRESVVMGGIGVDLHEFSPVLKNLEPKMTFLMVARILKEKGVFEFAEAAKKFKGKNLASFWFVGGLDSNPGGIKEKEWKGLIEDSGIEWFGSVADVKSFLERCDIFVLPSYREGIPRSTQEAMAMGKAVITTDVHGCRETVTQGVNGMLVAARSSESLSRAFEYFLEHPQRVISCGIQSRRMAEESFDSRQKDSYLVSLISGNGL